MQEQDHISEQDTATERWKARVRTLGIVWIASAGFTGYFPVASGTIGSLVGVLLVWLTRGLPLSTVVLFIVIICLVGVWSADRAGKYYGVADSGRITIDEVAGMMITMVGIPVTGYWLFWGFLIFRFFDIVKLPPASYFDQRVHNGWGVMMDDVVSGIYANLLVHLMVRAAL